MRGKKNVRAVLATAGCAPVELSEQEVWSWQQRWRTVFAKELHAATGVWVLRDFDWHVFSYGHHDAKMRDAAWNEYRRVMPCGFVVVSADSRLTFGFSCEGKPPDRLKLGLDIIVAPMSLLWTMVFT